MHHAFTVLGTSRSDRTSANSSSSSSSRGNPRRRYEQLGKRTHEVMASIRCLNTAAVEFQLMGSDDALLKVRTKEPFLAVQFILWISLQPGVL